MQTQLYTASESHIMLLAAMGMMLAKIIKAYYLKKCKMLLFRKR